MLQFCAWTMVSFCSEWDIYPIYSVPWLLMSWQCDDLGNQQPWSWPISTGIFQSQQQNVLFLKSVSYFQCVYKCSLAYTHFVLRLILELTFWQSIPDDESHVKTSSFDYSCLFYSGSGDASMSTGKILTRMNSILIMFLVAFLLLMNFSE